MSDLLTFWTQPAVPLDDDATRQAVRLVATTGDSDALLSLCRAYAPAMASAVRAHTRTSLDTEDARSAAVEALVRACRIAHEHGRDRLSLRVVLQEVMAQAVAESMSGPTVPARTARRVARLLAEHNGDVRAATAAAEAMPAKDRPLPDTIAAVAAALRIGPLPDSDAGMPASDVPAVATDEHMVATAFRAVDDRERRVCRFAYGFADYRPLIDEEISERMGMTRPTVQRVRKTALRKMRTALVGTLGA